MDESKAFTVKQSQVGDDSGYSCTSTQSKYSQSASSGYSYFEERRSTTLKITEDGKMSTSNSKSTEQPNKNIRRDISCLETTTNLESSNNKSLKSEQVDVTAFEPQLDQLFNIDELKQLHSTSINMKKDESTNLSDDTKEDHDRNNLAFLQLVTLCKSYRDYLNTNNGISYPYDESSIDIVLEELNKHQEQLKEIIESNEVHSDSFRFVVSMDDGLIINTCNNIHKSMGYHNDGQGRSFIDFIHPKDRISFISYVTSVLKDPCKISRRDGISTVTYLKDKNIDGFYCNMRRYRSLNTGYSIYKNQYQVCKLTIAFKNVSCASTSPCSEQINKIPQSQLHLIVKAQLIHSAYTYPEEKKVSPMSFITKHDALFEWCYVDHLILSHFGYLPQNIIGKSIFNYYNIEDLSIIRGIHENMTKPGSAPFIGNPYRFKCQNGDFALVQTEWSNFVNPWTGRVEFVTGKHKVIQGPINPDVITPIDDVMPEATLTDDKTNPNKIYEDIKKLLNKNIYEATSVSKQTNHTSDLSTNVKNQKCKDLASYMKNCFAEDIDPSIQFPLEVKIQPETCGFSNRDFVILGEISPHTSKSSSGTPPSYTQLNYNDNILRFFKSNLQSNSSEDLSDQNCHKEITSGKVTPFKRDMDKAQQDKITLPQNVTPSSSILVNYTTTSYYSEQNSKEKKNRQQPLTQKMLFRHNKKMEDDLVNQHKNNAKRIKSSVKQKQYLTDKNADTADVITHGIKRNISSQYENKICKLTKRKRLVNSNLINVITQFQASDDIATTNTVARATQIWPPSKVTRDSQTMVELPRSPPDLPNYNVPFGNNVMPGKHNEYKKAFTLRPHEQNRESLSNQLQQLTVPLYASIPVMNHIPQSLHYQNQKLEGFPVNQEEIIMSSDSEYSSFYSSILRYKTDNSDKEEYSWPPDFIKTNCPQEFIKKQPFRMENVTTPDIIFRYQMEHGEINEVLQKDMNVLNTFTQPLLVNEQLKQLCVELNVNGTSKTSYYEDGSSSSGGDECLISIGNNKKRKVNFSRMAMIYEENAPLPPPRLMSSNTNQST